MTTHEDVEMLHEAINNLTKAVLAVVAAVLITDPTAQRTPAQALAEAEDFWSRAR